MEQRRLLRSETMQSKDITKEYMYPPSPEDRLINCKDCSYWTRAEILDRESKKLETYDFGYCSGEDEYMYEDEGCIYGEE